MSHLTICIYASQVAACAGLHRYQTRAEALLSVWRRVHPDSYNDAVLRAMQRRDKGDGSPIPAPPACLNPDAARVEAEAAVREASRKVLGGSTTAPRTSTEALKVHAALSTEAARGACFKAYGTHAELGAVPLAESATGLKLVRDPTFLCKQVDDGLLVGGRVDAIAVSPDDGSTVVVELKNRIRRLFGTIPEYEKPQLATYMELTGAKTGCLVEVLRARGQSAAAGGGGGTQAKAHWMYRDAEYWEGTIMPRLRDFRSELCLLIGSTDSQDRACEACIAEEQK